MSFLEPLLLALGVAAAVPLLLHLMRRRSGTRIEFPAARYLARAEEENSRKLRWRNLALMILRVLLVLLIAMAAARPVGRVAGAGHPPTALAIVLDNSLSSGAVVGGQPVLADLVTAARSIVESSQAEDRLWLLTADGRVQGGARDDLLAALAEVAPTEGGGDLPAAVGRAAGLARASELPARSIVVLTDGQASAWSQAASPDRLPIVAYQPPEPPPANHGVTAAQARPLRFTPRGDVVARVSGPDTLSYTVRVGEQVLARGTVRGGEEVVARVAPAGRGWLAATVEIPPDELRADDRRHLALWAGLPPAVRVDASAGPFIPTAVDALVQSERLARGGDALIAAADAADRLPALLFAPAEPVRAGAANRNLERLGVPWRFGAPVRAPAEVRGDRLEGVTATLRYPLTPVPGTVADTLATAGGGAWAVAGEGYVIVGSPATQEATNLPLRASFVPWLAHVVGQHLSGSPAVVLHAAPGQPVRLPAWVTGWEAASGGGQQLVGEGQIAAPDAGGVYFLLRGADRVGALVVNPEPEESVLERLSPTALRARLGARDARVVTRRDELAAAAFDPAAGRSLVSPFLVLALLVLAAEGWTSRRGGGGR